MNVIYMPARLRIVQLIVTLVCLYSDPGIATGGCVNRAPAGTIAAQCVDRLGLRQLSVDSCGERRTNRSIKGQAAHAQGRTRANRVSDIGGRRSRGHEERSFCSAKVEFLRRSRSK